MSVLVFNKWAVDGIKVDDMGLQKYVTLDPRFVPKTGARYAGRKFYKSKTFIVERLINKIMIPGHKAKKHLRSSGHNTGKSALAYAIVMDAFKLIEQKTKQNPVAVFVKALENAAPREEIVTIEYGGARYPKATDCAPQRRVDVALRYFVQGSYDRCFNKKTSIQEALADELLCASRLDPKSLAIAKKGEIERQADSSR
jgi:small subunit ribosomal protein S7